MILPKKVKSNSKKILQIYNSLLSTQTEGQSKHLQNTHFLYSISNSQVLPRQTFRKLPEYSEELGFKINEISVDELFDKYKENGFIYPEKMVKLAPYFEKIKKNWKKLLLKNQSLLSIYTYENPTTHHWASVCSWKENQELWCCQHLSSNGNPVGSRAVLLGMQKGFIDNAPTQQCNYVQNWFRPNNKYATKVFGTLQNTVNNTISCIFEHCYLAVSLQSSLPKEQDIIIKEYEPTHLEELINFLTIHRHQIFVESGGFKSDNIQLEKTNNLYQSVDLFKKRYILLAFSKSQLVGVAIAYRSPIGLNFSFLENRCELIINKNLKSDLSQKICTSLLSSARCYYTTFEAPYIPVITDNHNAILLTIMGHNIIRKYNQSIWSKDGYEDWYKNVDKIFSRVCEREKRKSLVHATN